MSNLTKKKSFTLFLALMLSLSLASCGTKNPSATGSTSAETTSPEALETDAPTEEASDSNENTTENTNQSETNENTDSTETDMASYQVAKPVAGDTIVTITFKDYGDVKIKMFPKEAPKAVENFVTHAKDGYYNGLTMHRVISDFMIQGGDPKGNGTGGESIWNKEFENETVEYLNVIRGSLCMANAGPDTNGSQFFITQASEIDKSYLEGLTELQKQMYTNYAGCPWLTGGYTVFGQVFEGMDVVDTISNVETDGSTDAPITPVVIEKIDVTTK